MLVESGEGCHRFWGEELPDDHCWQGSADLVSLGVFGQGDEQIVGEHE
jgi:hypothetical protein